jgi:SAM-dependent methyltransferase
MGLDGLNVARLTLVEIDPRQVSRNKIAHETIVGDMQTIELPAESFDLVICYNVIEHLPRLTEALERMSRVVKRDGLVVIGAPVPNSLSGLAARFTPHLVHVWICGICSNGRMRENRAVRPFPVAYQKLVQPSALQSHARKLGLEPVYFRTYFGSLIEEIGRKNPLLGRYAATIISCCGRSEHYRPVFSLSSSMRIEASALVSDSSKASGSLAISDSVFM